MPRKRPNYVIIRSGEKIRDYYLSLVRGERRGWWAALLRGGLWTLSLPYGWAVRLRNWLYAQGWKRVHHAGVPVVSVGNLTVGGTGKTPCVEYIASFFRQQGAEVGILSRGYCSVAGADQREAPANRQTTCLSAGASRCSAPATTSSQQLSAPQAVGNDEAGVLQANLPDVPHLQGADRVALAQKAVRELGSEVLVLDDGFQHRRLHRDLDVVLVDATAPWGHRHLLPRGLLREPITGLRRADAVLLTRCDQVSGEGLKSLRHRIALVAPGIAVIQTRHRPDAWINADGKIKPVAEWRRGPAAAFCGVGNPRAFRRTLEDLGVEVRELRIYPDHHPYSRDDIAELDAWARQQPPDTNLITTQKDLVKLPRTRLGDKELWALRIRLDIQHGKELLEAKLSELLGQRKAQAA